MDGSSEESWGSDVSGGDVRDNKSYSYINRYFTITAHRRLNAL